MGMVGEAGLEPATPDLEGLNRLFYVSRYDVLLFNKYKGFLALFEAEE